MIFELIIHHSLSAVISFLNHFEFIRKLYKGIIFQYYANFSKTNLFEVSSFLLNIQSCFLYSIEAFTFPYEKYWKIILFFKKLYSAYIENLISNSITNNEVKLLNTIIDQSGTLK